MSSEWLPSTVGEFCPFHYGKSLPQRTRKRGSIPVISSAGVVDAHEIPFVNGPGVVIGRKGTVGSVTLSSGPFWPIDTTFFVENEPEVRDIRFVYYLLKTLGLENMNTDSAVPGLNRENAHALLIHIPPLAEQREIANLLQNFDDRITLLRETNTTLESIAQAIFKSWFVDFDPVRAKMEGRRPDGMDEDIATLFPEEFEESKFGLIPRGWKIDSLARLSRLNPESLTAKSHPAVLLYVDLANIKENKIATVTKYMFGNAPSRARRVLRDGDTIIGTVRPGNRSFGLIHASPANLIGSTGFAVLRPTIVESTEFIYLAATQDASIEYLSHVADGGAYPAVRPDIVSGMQVVTPTNGVMQAFHTITAPLLNAVSQNLQRVRTLESLRDTLLPRLISGRLRLPEAKSLVQEASP